MPNDVTSKIVAEDKNGGPNHLAEWREFRRLTQTGLADLVGANANMISYLESGERGLSAKWLRRLAPALDTTPGMLLDHHPDDVSAEIVDLWIQASPQQKHQIIDIATILLKTDHAEGK